MYAVCDYQSKENKYLSNFKPFFINMKIKGLMLLKLLFIILVYSCPIVVMQYNWEENLLRTRQGVTASKQLAITLQPKGTYAVMSHLMNKALG